MRKQLDAVRLIACALVGALPLLVGTCERNAGSGGPAAASPVETAIAATAPVDADRGLCRALCARAAVLRCPGGADCESHCEEMRAVPTCGREMQAALRCFTTLPASGWECAADGLPSVKGGQCEREQAGVAACLAR